MFESYRLKEKGKYFLNENEVHVWHVNAHSASPLELKEFLTNDEIRRANRYYFLKDRENFIISRGVLRILISRYLDISPHQADLHFNKYGKPFLKKRGKEGMLEFNVSHSNGELLFAFILNHAIGIDIEFIRPEFAEMEIARHFFSRAEMLALSVLPEDIRKVAFFNCWTRKEAFIKAKGKGLSIPLDSFDVSVVPGESPEILSVHNNPGENKQWRVINLDVGEKFCASLAVQGNPNKIERFEWGDEIYVHSSIL